MARLMVAVTVVPLLEEMMSFLGSESPLLCDATAELQLLIVGRFCRRLTRLWLRGEPRQDSEGWYEEYAKEVTVGAIQCMLCGECMEGRQHHPVQLNTCIGASNTVLYTVH